MKPKQPSKKDIYEKEILEIIKAKFLTKIAQIFTYYSGCSYSTFFNLKLNESDTIKKALQDNRTKACHSLLSKWVNSDNSTLQITAFKILCDEDDRKKLSMNYSEVTGKDGSPLIPDNEIKVTIVTTTKVPEK